jgi:TetR/AcrR family transcriptional regulator, copper-responsive repressor
MRIGKKLCSCGAAAATGLNRPSLYAAFGDQHALYLRVLQETRASSVEGIRQRRSGNTPLHNAVLDFFTEAADSTLTGPKAIGVS